MLCSLCDPKPSPPQKYTRNDPEQNFPKGGSRHPAGYPRKVQENKRSHTVSISQRERISFNLLARFAHCLYRCHVLVGSIYAHLGHAHVEFLIQACVIATVEAEVCSSSVSIVYVVRLCIVFSKAALPKRGFHGTHGTPSGSAAGSTFHVMVLSGYKSLVKLLVTA